MTRTRTTMTTPSDAGLCRGLTAPISAPPSVTLRLTAGRSVLDQPRPGRNDDEDENHDDDAFGRRAVPGIDCTDLHRKGVTSVNLGPDHSLRDRGQRDSARILDSRPDGRPRRSLRGGWHRDAGPQWSLLSE